MADIGSLPKTNTCPICGKRKISLLDTLAGKWDNRCQCKNKKQLESTTNSGAPRVSTLLKKPIVELKVGTHKRDLSNESAMAVTQDDIVAFSEVDSLAESASHLMGASWSGSSSGNKSEPEILEAGTRIAGRYKVESLLGIGGMGAVYKVTHEFLNKTFALKILHKDVLANEQIIARFDREAKASVSLGHPNLVAVADYGMTSDGAPFLVMDYIDGKSLGEELNATGFLPVERALPIFIQMCAGLESAHSKGVVHRDMKPNNVMLFKNAAGQEQIKIVDFGISKIVGPNPGANALTQTGEIFGSPLYMSPEQCRGLPVDHRSDIYSLGCVMYECLCGEPPFIADNPVQTILKHLHEEPQTLTQRGVLNLPEGLEKIVDTCLNKDPDKRYQTVADLKRDLERLQHGEKPQTARGSASREESYWRNIITFSIHTSIAASIVACMVLIAFMYLHFKDVAKDADADVKPWVRTLHEGIRHQEDDRDSAEVTMKHALEMAERNRAPLADLAQINFYIGRINKRDDKDEARQFFKTARRQANEIADPVLEAKCNEGLAFTYFDGDARTPVNLEPDVAKQVIFWLERAVVLRNSVRDPDTRTLSTDYKNLAKLYAFVGDDDKSEKMAAKVHQMEADRDRAWNVVVAYQLEAESAMKKKNYARMEERFDLALQKGKESVTDSRHLRDIVTEYLDALTKIGQGNSAKAKIIRRDYLSIPLPEDIDKNLN
jgi:serine/threonine protein kinase